MTNSSWEFSLIFFLFSFFYIESIPLSFLSVPIPYGSPLVQTTHLHEKKKWDPFKLNNDSVKLSNASINNINN